MILLLVSLKVGFYKRRMPVDEISYLSNVAVTFLRLDTFSLRCHNSDSEKVFDFALLP